MKIFTDSQNSQKIAAIACGFAQAGYKKGSYEIIGHTLRDPIGVKPLTRSSTLKVSKERAERTAHELSKRGLLQGGCCIGIQKGTTVMTKHEQCVLVVCVSMTYPDRPNKSFAHFSYDVPLPDEVQRLVMRDKVALNDACERAFGPEYGPRIKNQELSLYEFLTGKKEVDWIALAVSAALLPLEKRLESYFLPPVISLEN